MTMGEVECIERLAEYVWHLSVVMFQTHAIAGTASESASRTLSSRHSVYDYLYNFFLLINDPFTNKQFRLLVNGSVYYFVNGFACTSNRLRLRLQMIPLTSKRFRLLVIGLILEQAPA